MDSIGIVIVLYNPNVAHIHRLNNFINCVLESKVCTCIVVDNSFEITRGLESNINVVYIYNNCNMGIAYAQNIGIREAQRLNCKYIVFFDQDSDYDMCFVINMVDAYKQIKLQEPHIAVLGPFIANQDIAKVETSNINSENYIKVKTVISSGSVVETTIFDVVGTMEDKLFIDLVDHEWCWRAQGLGYCCCQSSQIVLPHKVGEYNRTIFGYPIIVSSPFRYYYKYRNYVLMLSRSYVPLKWKIKETIRKTVELFCVPMMTKQKSIFYHMLKGIKDGVIGKDYGEDLNICKR